MSDLQELMASLDAAKKKARKAHQEAGKAGTHVHLARMERDSAQYQLEKARARLEASNSAGWMAHNLLRELMEIIRPGMVHGDLQEDHAATVAEVRRLRGIALSTPESTPDETARLTPYQGPVPAVTVNGKR